MNGWNLGPKAEPNWWNFIRQLIMFWLGVAVIIYAVASTGHDIAFLVTGLVLVGIIPIEDVLGRFARRAPSEGDSE